MKKNLKFLILAPCLMAVLCEDTSDDCTIEDPNVYVVNVENITEAYPQNETIWLNAKTSSMLIDRCTPNDESGLITDRDVFLDGLFILKLNNTLEGLNAEVFEDAAININIGDVFSFNVCSEAINYLPVLTDDNLFYQYRVGVSIPTPGDYCIVNARNSYFNFDNVNNAQVFNIYNNLDNKIKFESCGDIYTRNGTDGFYFFSVQE